MRKLRGAFSPFAIRVAMQSSVGACDNFFTMKNTDGSIEWILHFLTICHYTKIEMASTMTQYGFVHSRHIVLRSQYVQEKKAVRRKLLEEVERRRRENFRRFYAKIAAGQAK